MHLGWSITHKSYFFGRFRIQTLVTIVLGIFRTIHNVKIPTRSAQNRRVKARKDDLLARLGKKEKLTDEEVEWLDHTANSVDKEAVVSLLEKASDYEHIAAQSTAKIIGG